MLVLAVAHTLRGIERRHNVEIRPTPRILVRILGHVLAQRERAGIPDECPVIAEAFAELVPQADR